MRRSARAARGEADGERLLRTHGYEILGTQVTLRAALWVNGQREEYLLRVDWLVAKAGQRYAADAKTGADAPSIRSRPTRRQLLEYVHQYAVDGALLVDPEAGQISVVHFDVPDRTAPRTYASWLGIFVLGAVCGVLATAAWSAAPCASFGH